LRFFALLFLRVDAFFLTEDEPLLMELDAPFDEVLNCPAEPLLDDKGAELELPDPVGGESTACGVWAVGALVEGLSAR
jgi:hypothetical protein